ncbi:putative acyltransferase KNAG_0J00970 [Huiozyma naganishii CBS 8797]|uniref:Phospholipid/glycerol acyltransferase domain-containing protein n=1 Tax=Huiozyma naganishii (strain ATCC MYA-139 / BCRC 22969 / CBS 8797 / KCTC 17520 / NBRC 10181 / NCYC 3082 / Yp74L-3) TaxID=1071383 RepID=J7S9L6_HUIN7|nr:hypothetical protein KNAG_0J00970 [Kazachstania naganishii CBS 8797]CCK72179.1 hypothetical protein KNAG_0J00970 [Kazachstania naganishii CBS 8797]
MTFVASLVYNVRKVVIPLVSMIVFIENILLLMVIQVPTVYCLPTNSALAQSLLDFTKKLFVITLTSILSVVAPAHVRITTDNDSIPAGTIYMDIAKGRVSSQLRPDSVTICNHQIYTDWIYLWWLAYTSNLGGRVHIMLKKSLRRIPILGFGMKNFKFLFMNRKWADDRVNVVNNLRELDANARGLGPLHGGKPMTTTENGTKVWNQSTQPSYTEELRGDRFWPYNFILFPEGTNLTQNTRNKTEIYAKKVNKTPFRHVLMPHVTGLKFTLETLEPSLDILYDVTVAYSGVKPSGYAADSYGLKNIFLEGQYPKLVDIYVRAFDIKSIPIKDDEQFEKWVEKVWAEKDELMNNYYETGGFALDPAKTSSLTSVFNVCRYEFVMISVLPFITLLWMLKSFFYSLF